MTETGLLQDEPSMLLMDLGGWTVDLMRIDNAIPAADTAHSLELGMIRCVDDIREQVRRETGLSLTDAQIENTAGRSALHGQRYGARHCEQTRSQVHRASAVCHNGSGIRFARHPRRVAGRRRIGGEPPPKSQRRPL